MFHQNDQHANIIFFHMFCNSLVDFKGVPVATTKMPRAKQQHSVQICSSVTSQIRPHAPKQTALEDK